MLSLSAYEQYYYNNMQRRKRKYSHDEEDIHFFFSIENPYRRDISLTRETAETYINHIEIIEEKKLSQFFHEGKYWD